MAQLVKNLDVPIFNNICNSTETLLEELVCSHCWMIRFYLEDIESGLKCDTSMHIFDLSFFFFLSFDQKKSQIFEFCNTSN